MVAALPQRPLEAYLNFPMKEQPSLPAGCALVEIRHPMTVTKSDLCWLLNKSRFSQLSRYFKRQIYPSLPNSQHRDYRRISKFNERETQVILAILFQKGRLAQTRIDSFCEKYSLEKDAITEVVIKTTSQQINENLWIITKS